MAPPKGVVHNITEQPKFPCAECIATHCRQRSPYKVTPSSRVPSRINATYWPPLKDRIQRLVAVLHTSEPLQKHTHLRAPAGYPIFFFIRCALVDSQGLDPGRPQKQPVDPQDIKVESIFLVATRSQHEVHHSNGRC